MIVIIKERSYYDKDVSIVIEKRDEKYITRVIKDGGINFNDFIISSTLEDAIYIFEKLKELYRY